MARRENFDIIHRLYVMVVFVVVNLTEDLMLDNLVFMWLHDFVCNSYSRVSPCTKKKDAALPR
jgi:hypothetical protein